MRSVQDASMAGTDTRTRPRGPADPRLVFDVGFNVGQDTAFYLSQGYRVIAVEADPSLAERARARFGGEIQAGRLQVVNVGIASKEGFADFWICEEKPEFNSFHRSIAARDSYSHKCIQVPVLPFSAIIERFGVPYFLKIDIEGNDRLCLDALSPSSLPAYLSVESECPLDEKQNSVEDGLQVLQQLYSLGYRNFKLIDQLTFCSLSRPCAPHYVVDAMARGVLKIVPTRKLPGLGFMSRQMLVRHRLERKFRHEFAIGSSGPWGEDTPGKWVSYPEAERAYRYYRNTHFLARDAKFHSFWCDWHAKL